MWARSRTADSLPQWQSTPSRPNRKEHANHYQPSAASTTGDFTPKLDTGLQSNIMSGAVCRATILPQKQRRCAPPGAAGNSKIRVHKLQGEITKKWSHTQPAAPLQVAVRESFLPTERHLNTTIADDSSQRKAYLGA